MAREKLLSMIFTVESIMSNKTKVNNNSTEQTSEQQQPNQHQQQQVTNLLDFEAELARRGKPIRRTSNEVKLRANLTELYICLNQRRGMFETRVSIIC